MTPWRLRWVLEVYGRETGGKHYYEAAAELTAMEGRISRLQSVTREIRGAREDYYARRIGSDELRAELTEALSHLEEGDA